MQCSRTCHKIHNGVEDFEIDPTGSFSWVNTWLVMQVLQIYIGNWFEQNIENL